MNQNYLKLFEFISKKKPKRILLIAFEDAEVVKFLKENFSAQVDLLTKADFVGSGLKEISKKTRGVKYDLLIISNINSQVNRNKTSIDILALIPKSFYQFIYYDEKVFRITNKFKLLLVLFPKLFAGFLIAIYVLIKTYLFFYLFYPFTVRKKIDRKNQNKLILFLRTDLAGKILAGGSVTHIKGFISGARELGYETIYVGDFPLLNHPISIVVKPNPLLDFFDEIQLINYHFKLIKNLRKCLSETNVGLIYQRHSVFNASGVILSKLLKVPLILEVNYSEVWAKKNWSRLVFEKLAVKIENFALKNSDVIGVVSEVAKDQISKLGADENKIVVNPNGVDPKIFSPEVNGNEIKALYNLENYFVFGFIGTFSRWHGVETLFDAAVNVLSKNDRIKFLLIGDGNLKSTLQLQADQLGLNEKIVFTGIVPHEDVPKYLAACDVLISPHLGFESGERFFGSPTKLFEYMAMGKPIIASDLEQIGEIIIHEVNGLKFKPGDAEDLANLILRLSEDKVLCSRLGKQAREDVIKNFTWKQNAQRVLEKVFNL